jgi:tRNA pseudouridine38-40 synthase
MVYRLIVAYDGSPFAGWQRQPGAVTVQATIEEALASIIGHRVPVVGAGRTDAGVHALGQVAHLEVEWPVEQRALVHGVNHHLPPAVRVLEARRATDGFHARKCALAKEYRYRTSRATVLSPFEAGTTLRVAPVDVEAMRAATRLLPGRHDFTAFALAGGAHARPFRRILGAEWREAGEVLELAIVGDGFLRGMVRSLVGTLLEVGSGRRSVEDFAELLGGRPRDAAGPTAPAHGLVLRRVFYEPCWLAPPPEG